MENYRRRSCYFKCGSCTGRAISLRSLLKWKVSDLLIKSLCFNKLPRWFLCTLKFDVHWSRVKPKGDHDIKTFPFWAYHGTYTRTKKIRFCKSYYDSGQMMKHKFLFHLLTDIWLTFTVASGNCIVMLLFPIFNTLIWTWFPSGKTGSVFWIK